MRIRHIAIVTEDLERTAVFYQRAFGFRRLGAVRTPGHFPGTALDLTDGEVNFSLLRPRDDIARHAWSQGGIGPNHVGVEIADTGRVVAALRDMGVEIYGAEEADPPRFFKFRDPDGVEVDVATPDRSWRVA